MPPDQLVESFTRDRNNLKEQALDLPPERPEPDPDEAASSFATSEMVSIKDVENIISSPSSEKCAQDPVYIWILKE